MTKASGDDVALSSNKRLITGGLGLQMEIESLATSAWFDSRSVGSIGQPRGLRAFRPARRLRDGESIGECRPGAGVELPASQVLPRFTCMS